MIESKQLENVKPYNNTDQTHTIQDNLLNRLNQF